jgi:hypothetical protein
VAFGPGSATGGLILPDATANLDLDLGRVGRAALDISTTSTIEHADFFQSEGRFGDSTTSTYSVFYRGSATAVFADVPIVAADVRTDLSVSPTPLYTQADGIPTVVPLFTGFSGNRPAGVIELRDPPGFGSAFATMDYRAVIAPRQPGTFEANIDSIPIRVVLAGSTTGTVFQRSERFGFHDIYLAQGRIGALIQNLSTSSGQVILLSESMRAFSSAELDQLRDRNSVEFPAGSNRSFELIQGSGFLNVDRTIDLQPGNEYDILLLASASTSFATDFGTLSATAFLDPRLEFDQAAFDALHGANSFRLADHFTIELSPNLAPSTAPSPVPEPSSLALLTTGAVAALGYGRRRRQRKTA